MRGAGSYQYPPMDFVIYGKPAAEAFARRPNASMPGASF